LPAKLAGIIGVSRSGLTPAALLCQHLHLPLWILRQDATPAQHDAATWAGRGDIIPAGNGWRIASRPATGGPLLVVDDTQMTGRSIARAREVVARELPGREVLYTAVYKNPQLPQRSVDYYAAALLKPHFLEWNLFNSVHLPHTAFDFDGVLTRDGTNEPQYLPRKGRVPLIVTGRSERHRAASLGWLAHWGVKVNRLVMFPGETPREPLPIARYKAEHFANSGLAYFVESCPEQAAEIAAIVRRPVICPAAGKVF
jgi:hypoxanthine phosphoribosyltransferase